MLPRLWKQLSSIWGWGEREKGNLEDIAVRLIAGSERSELCSSHISRRCEEMTRGETARALLESVANLVAVSQENIPSPGCHKCRTEQRIWAVGEERAGEKRLIGKNGKKKSKQG